MFVTERLRQLARAVGLGPLLYRAYHAPAGFVRKIRREGAANLWLSRQGRMDMQRAAAKLPTLDPPAGLVFDVHFMTGDALWYQTCFCFYSLQLHSPIGLRPVIHSDGTLRPEQQRTIQRVAPHACFERLSATEARLDRALPRSRFPLLRGRRDVAPLFRKLLDIHVGSPGWKLFLDSDMLFFREPTALLDWLRSPEIPCHMLDVASAYGYSPSLMAELAGCPIPERINTGIRGLCSEDVDWPQMESWCRAMIEREGAHYLQEQALTALHLAQRPHRAMPADDYLVLPSRAEAIEPRAVLHHYVAQSKAWYFRHGWRHVVATSSRRHQEVVA